MRDERERRFLELLWSEQRSANLSDYALARKLGAAQSTISRMKSGQRGVGTDFMFRVVECFPALRDFLAVELLTSKKDGATTQEDETPKVGAA